MLLQGSGGAICHGLIIDSGGEEVLYDLFRIETVDGVLRRKKKKLCYNPLENSMVVKVLKIILKSRVIDRLLM